MTKVKKALITAAGILFWLIIWQIIAVRLNSKILLVSPVEVVKRLAELIPTGEFWRSVLFSAGRILSLIHI